MNSLWIFVLALTVTTSALFIGYKSLSMASTSARAGLALLSILFGYWAFVLWLTAIYLPRLMEEVRKQRPNFPEGGEVQFGIDLVSLMGNRPLWLAALPGVIVFVVLMLFGDTAVRNRIFGK